MNAISSPRASRTPRFRAWPEPTPPARTSRTGALAAAAMSAVESEEPSSTTTTSNSGAPAWAARHASVRGSVAAASRAGTTTLTRMARECNDGDTPPAPPAVGLL